MKQSLYVSALTPDLYKAILCWTIAVGQQKMQLGSVIDALPPLRTEG